MPGLVWTCILPYHATHERDRDQEGAGFFSGRHCDASVQGIYTARPHRQHYRLAVGLVPDELLAAVVPLQDTDQPIAFCLRRSGGGDYRIPFGGDSDIEGSVTQPSGDAQIRVKMC